MRVYYGDSRIYERISRKRLVICEDKEEILSRGELNDSLTTDSFFLSVVADKAPSEASFRGTEYLTIDLSKGDPVLSTQESISLQFKTRQPNGLLFYSGKCSLCVTADVGVRVSAENDFLH